MYVLKKKLGKVNKKKKNLEKANKKDKIRKQIKT